MSEHVCTICGASVSKRQSVAVDREGHRACRSHSEAVETSRKLVSEIEEKYRKEKEEVQRRAERHHHHPVVPRGPSCWCCFKEGLMARDHWLRMIVASEKMFLTGKSILDSKAMKEAYGKPPERILTFVAVNDGSPILQSNPDLESMAMLSEGSIFICRECADRHGLADKWDASFCPSVSPEQLKMGMMLLDLPVARAAKDLAKFEVAVERDHSVAVFDEKAKP